jgi:hypothetical protein
MSDPAQTAPKARFSSSDYDAEHRAKTVELLLTKGMKAAREHTTACVPTIYSWRNDPRFNRRLPQAGGAPSEEGVVSESIGDTVSGTKTKSGRKSSPLAGIEKVTMVQYCPRCGTNVHVVAQALAVHDAMQQE